MDILYAPFCFRGVRTTFGHYDDMMIMMIDSRVCGGNIAISLKKLRNQTVLRRDLLKALHSCQNKVVSTVQCLAAALRLAAAKQAAPAESTVLSDYTG